MDLTAGFTSANLVSSLNGNQGTIYAVSWGVLRKILLASRPAALYL